MCKKPRKFSGEAVWIQVSTITKIMVQRKERYLQSVSGNQKKTFYYTFVLKTDVLDIILKMTVYAQFMK